MTLALLQKKKSSSYQSKKSKHYDIQDSSRLITKYMGKFKQVKECLDGDEHLEKTTFLRPESLTIASK